MRPGTEDTAGARRGCKPKGQQSAQGRSESSRETWWTPELVGLEMTEGTEKKEELGEREKVVSPHVVGDMTDLVFHTMAVVQGPHKYQNFWKLMKYADEQNIRPVPCYKHVSTEGPSHDPRFVYSVTFRGLTVSGRKEKTKVEAIENCAGVYCELHGADLCVLPAMAPEEPNEERTTSSPPGGSGALRIKVKLDGALQKTGSEPSAGVSLKMKMKIPAAKVEVEGERGEAGPTTVEEEAKPPQHAVRQEVQGMRTQNGAAAGASDDTVTASGNKSQDLKKEVSSMLVEGDESISGPPAEQSKSKPSQQLSPAGPPAQVYCVCRQPYDETRPMLACDICDEWFHYDCVGLLPPGTQEEDEDVSPEEYHCQRCCEGRGRRYPQARDGRSTGIVHEDSMLLHAFEDEKGRGGDRMAGRHVENPSRITNALRRLRVRGIASRCRYIKPREAEEEELLRCHSKRHIMSVMCGDCVRGKKPDPCQAPISPGGSLRNRAEDDLADDLDDDDLLPDLYFSEGTARAARMAAGCAVEAATEVVRSSVQNAFALVRPPGHHAEHECAMGFCFFNNCAVAAKAALKQEGVDRVMILDWDVHHGNGISNAFYEDDRVLYVSIHRYGRDFFPGTGAADEAGEGKGLGYTVNIPFEATGMGDIDYLAAYQLVVEPIAKKFDPQLVIVACGFDAARGDPLGEMLVSPAGFYHLTARIAMNVQSKMTIVLEGGYNHSNVAKCSEAVVSAMLGDPVPLIKASLDDPINPNTIKTLKKVLRVQRKHWDCFSTPAHKTCQAAGANQLRVSDLHLNKHTAAMKKHARERSQILEFGKVMPGLQRKGRGAKSKRSDFRINLKDSAWDPDANPTQAVKRRKKGAGGGLKVAVPESKTGVTLKARQIKAVGKVGERSPDSHESAMSPLQQRKYNKMLESPNEDRTYLVEEFTNSLLLILQGMVSNGKAVTAEAGRKGLDGAGAASSAQVAKIVEFLGKNKGDIDTFNKAGGVDLTQLGMQLVEGGLLQRAPGPGRPKGSKKSRVLDQKGVQIKQAADIAVAKAVSSAKDGPSEARSLNPEGRTGPYIRDEALAALVGSKPSTSATLPVSVPTASVLGVGSLAHGPGASGGLDIGSLLLSRLAQQQQQQLSSTLHTQLKGLLGTGSPPQPAVSQASQAAQVLQGQAQPALPSSVLGNTPFLRQAAQLLHQAGGGGAGGVGVQAQHLYPQSASQYPLLAAAERQRQSLAAAREQEVLSNLAQRIRSNQLNPASAQLLRQGLNQIQSGVPVTAAPPLAPSGTASSITQQIQQIQIQQQLQELQQLQQLQKLGGLGGLASLPLSQLQKLASQLGNQNTL